MPGRPPDRRRAWRYPVHLDVNLENGKGVSRDVSASGIYFETDAALTPGQVINFSFCLEKVYPDVRLDLKCAGTIARIDQRGGRVGVAVTIDAWSFEPSDFPGVSPDAPSGAYTVE
jgi:hypothetical protein